MSGVVLRHIKKFGYGKVGLKWSTQLVTDVDDLIRWWQSVKATIRLWKTSDRERL